MAISARPFLMFQGDAEKAMEYYASLFAGAAVSDVEKYGAGEQGPEGAFKRAIFTLLSQSFIVFDSPVKHTFAFTPSFSIFVECDSEAEIERLAVAFLEGGQALMPLGAYGFSRKFAWVNDRYGVSWQLNLE